MRRIFVALALAFIVLGAPAFAQNAPSVCTLDGISSGTVGQCPVLDTDDALISQNIGGAKLVTTNTLSHTPIFVHGICKYVDAVDHVLTADTLVPFSTLTEWQAFLDHKPAGVHVAECCLPRPLNQTDIPIPTETCSTGWVFQALVDPTDSTRTLATVGGNGDFVLASGILNDPNYPITRLPIERGDIGALLPAQASTAYVGKYHCDGTVDFTTSQSPVNTSNTTSTSSFNNIVNGNGQVINTTSTSSTNTNVSTGTGGTATNVTKLMGFAMQCVNTQWKYTSPSCFGKTTGYQTQACPAGFDGLITNAVILQCDGTSTTQVVSNTCAQTCPARTITTENRDCPAGQVGTITVEVAKLCSSQQPVDATTQTEGCFCDTSETVKTNTCQPCVPSTDEGDQTQLCPDGQTGHIIIHTNKVCVSQNGQCVCHDETTVKENTCTTPQCPPTTTTVVTQACPSGQTGIITINRTTTCHKSCECGGSQCVCSDTDTVVSNTCVNTCTPSSHDVCTPCPAGQTGTVTTTTTHVCPSDTDVVTTHNTCVPVCTPSSHDVSTPCPAGQTGTVTTTTTHVCPSNTDVVTTHNTCVPVCTPSSVTTPGQCPAGFSGTSSTTVQHICPDNRDVTTTQNNCTQIITNTPEETPVIIPIPVIIPDFDTGFDDVGFEGCDCTLDGFDPEFDGFDSFDFDW